MTGLTKTPTVDDESRGYLSPPSYSEISLSPPPFFHRRTARPVDTVNVEDWGVPLLPDFDDDAVVVASSRTGLSWSLSPSQSASSPQLSMRTQARPSAVVEAGPFDNSHGHGLSLTSSTDSWMTARTTTPLTLDVFYSKWQKTPGSAMVSSRSNITTRTGAPPAHVATNAARTTTHAPPAAATSAILEACHAKWQRVEPLMVLTDLRDESNAAREEWHRRDMIAARRAARALDPSTKSTPRVFHRFEEEEDADAGWQFLPRHPATDENDDASMPPLSPSMMPSSLPHHLSLSVFFETLDRSLAAGGSSPSSSSSTDSPSSGDGARQQHQQPVLSSKMEMPSNNLSRAISPRGGESPKAKRIMPKAA